MLENGFLLREEVEPLTEKTLTLADNYFSHRFPVRYPGFSFAARAEKDFR